jgi:hypothetical protein
MRIKIGKYKNYVGPYQIADKIFFWVDKYPELKDGAEGFENRLDYRAKEWLGNFLAYGFNKAPSFENSFTSNYEGTWFYKLLTWIHSKQERTIKIHIDKWDTWSMDSTLSLIVLPMLEQLKASKHGGPQVDDEDVPEELRSTSAPPRENEWDVDDNHFKRWDWVLDEMIWAHRQKTLDTDPSFWVEEPEGLHFVPCEGDSSLSEMKYTKAGLYDHKASEEYHKRMANGFRLFGRYYQNLWD